MTLKQEHALAMLREFCLAEYARRLANEKLQLALAAITKTDLEGLFLVDGLVLRVNHFDCDGPRVEIVGGLKNLDDLTSEIEITEDEEDNDDLIPW